MTGCSPTPARWPAESPACASWRVRPALTCPAWNRTVPAAWSARLASDLQEVQRVQFDGVSAFIVNGRVIEGAQPAQAFADVIEGTLRQ